MKPKLSVIIPVYNVEDYLQECLDSVLINTSLFSDGEVEVIVVDDGSTDRSSKIAKDFCSTHSVVNYFRRENGGLSAARNTGLFYAKGKYLFFLDSDDFLAESILYNLVEYAETNNCGIVQCGICYYSSDKRTYTAGDTNSFSSNITISRENAFGLLIDNIKIKSFACGKLYNRDVIDGIEFMSGRFFEDIYWQYQVIGNSHYSNYGILNIAGYYYRQRSESISGTFSMRKIDLLEGNVEMIHYVVKNYPTLVYRSVRRFWKNKIAFDNELRKSKLKIAPSELQRLASIEAELSSMSAILNHDTDYRIWSISPFLYFLWGKLKRLRQIVLKK